MTVRDNGLLCRYFSVHRLLQKLVENRKFRLDHPLESSIQPEIDSTNDSSPYKNPLIQTCSFAAASQDSLNSQYKHL